MSTDTRKVVVITGCSAGGIGDALAKEFHHNGLRVIATARNVSAMDSLTALGIETLRLDVTDSKDIEDAKSRVSELTGGKIHVLVNNAGIACPVAATDLTLDIIKDVFDVNLFGAMAMVQAFVPLLIASGEGRIVQMGSIGGTMPFPFSCVYNSSKAALHSFGDTLRVELAPFNIKVITIIGGTIESNLMETKLPWHGIPEGSLYKPIQEEYQTHRIDHLQDGAMPTKKLAQNIVSETLKRHPCAWLFSGTHVWLSWFLGTFGGRRAFDRLLSDMFGITKLSTLMRQTADKE